MAHVAGRAAPTGKEMAMENKNAGMSGSAEDQEDMEAIEMEEEAENTETKASSRVGVGIHH